MENASSCAENGYNETPRGKNIQNLVLVSKKMQILVMKMDIMQQIFKK